ncbi:hypothetical protein CTheo_8519 [Ceratobasidium theobromae]|uniref:Uncharacterized protein n=1 Tax=Ceratobasidium theobromae TaxID=1582974 RepID=A0A5N5Q8D1_9AGAM|nr:hypothetical protein CTheo_8519 [Ceratobasidium theobromae]
MRLNLPPNALPKLSHFLGHYTQALAIVPHRPVRSVHITQVDDAVEFEPSDVFVCLKDTVETLAHSTAPLEELRLNDEDAYYGLLEVASDTLPDLRQRHTNPLWANYLQYKNHARPLRLMRRNIQSAYSPEPMDLSVPPSLSFNHRFPPNAPQIAFYATLYVPFPIPTATHLSTSLSRTKEQWHLEPACPLVTLGLTAHAPMIDLQVDN